MKEVNCGWTPPKDRKEAIDAMAKSPALPQASLFSRRSLFDPITKAPIAIRGDAIVFPLPY